MKLYKIFFIFIIAFAVSFAFSQEEAVTVDSAIKENKDVSSEQNKVTEKTVVDSNTNQSVEKIVEQKETAKKVSKEPLETQKAKDVVKVSIAKEEETPAVDTHVQEDFLFTINEGNFKYKRIPEIKLEEKSALIVDMPQSEPVAAETSDSSLKIFGLSKDSLKTLAKITALLLIFIIFILYKKRSRSYSRKSSGSVMKSFRK